VGCGTGNVANCVHPSQAQSAPVSQYIVTFV
jgi:hypothetical protein